MADDRILLKRSGVPGEIPDAEQLEVGELALNYADAAIYMKLLDGTVAEVGGIPASNNTIYVSVSGNDLNSGLEPGQPKRTIRAALNASSPFTTISIAAGTYVEETPLILPQFTTIHGVDQRITTVRPNTPTNDIFWVSNSCYITGLAIRGHQKPSFCVAFPSNVEIGTAQTGSATTITLDSAKAVSGASLDNYYREMRITINGGTGSGQARTIIAYDQANKIATVNSAWSTVPDNTSTYYIDIPIPATPAPTTARYSSHITASPYLYNLASVTADILLGSSTTSLAVSLGNKTLVIPTGLTNITAANYIRLYHNPTNYMIGKVVSYNSGTGVLVVNVDKLAGRGTYASWDVKIVCGAGMEIDGYKAAGLRSFVSAQFTQFNSGGNGVVMKNMGYAQLVSIYGICCEDAFLAESGGTASMGNCNVNFGNRGLVANGVGPLLMTGRSGFVYNRAKCERDTGLIVDALALDIKFSGNTQSVFAGIQYWNQDQLESIPVAQLGPTANTLSYLGSLAAKVVVNDTTGTRYQSGVSQITIAGSPATSTQGAAISGNFNQIVSILNNGTTGVTDLIVPNSLTANGVAWQNAYALLLANKEYFKAEANAYIDTVETSISLTTQQKTTCSRDVGYITDSVAFDILYSGNKQTIQSGVYYYGYSNVSAVGDEIPQTIEAYNYIKTLASFVVANNILPNPYQTIVPQVTSANPGSLIEAATTNTNISLITNIIQNGPDVAPPLRPIGLTANATPSAANSAALLLANRTFIAKEVIAYLDAQYGTSTANQTGFTINVSNIVACTDPRFAITSNTKPYLGLVMEIEGETTLDIQIGPGYEVGDVLKISYDNSNYFIGTVTAWDPDAETGVISVSSSVGSGLYSNWQTIKNGFTAPAGTPGRFTQEIVLPISGTITIAGMDTSLVIPKYRTITFANTVGDITTLELDERITGSLIINGVNYPNGLPSDVPLRFYQKSALSASGQTFEFVGSGTSVAVALPRNGGDIVQVNETVSSNGGIVYFTSTDQFGNFRIGEDLTINFNTGTLSGRTFTRSLFAQITPFVLALDS